MGTGGWLSPERAREEGQPPACPHSPWPLKISEIALGTSAILADGSLRLRPICLPDDIALALPWYSDPEVLLNSEGPGTRPYDALLVEKMYRRIAAQGELYIIEVSASWGWRDGGACPGGEAWSAIGDAALLADALPLVIGDPAWRGRGLGKRVLQLLIKRARALSWDRVRVKEVYAHNHRAQKLFQGLGFQATRQGGTRLGEGSWAYDLLL